MSCRFANSLAPFLLRCMGVAGRPRSDRPRSRLVSPASRLRHPPPTICVWRAATARWTDHRPRRHGPGSSPVCGPPCHLSAGPSVVVRLEYTMALQKAQPRNKQLHIFLHSILEISHGAQARDRQARSQKKIGGGTTVGGRRRGANRGEAN